MSDWRELTTYRAFNSVSEFGQWCDHTYQTNSGVRRCINAGGNIWAGGTVHDALRRAQTGAVPADVSVVERLMSEIELAVVLSNGEPRLGPAVAGFIPHVPNLLAGLPETMLAPSIDALSQHAPIKIIVDVGVSGGFSATDVRRRGAAVAAFAYLMSTIRPVELIAMSALGGQRDRARCYVPAVSLGASPFNTSIATFAMCDPAFLRRLSFCYRYVHDDMTGIPWGWDLSPANAQYEARIRELLGANDADLFIGGAYITDTLVKDPARWVREQIKKHAQEYLVD